MASITRFYALILSTVLLLSGVPGFFPDVPTFQVLVAFFELTLVHSVVHFAVGLLGLMITALASDQSVRIYTIGIALLYGALMAVGLIGVNFAPTLVFNSADNWLHGSIFVLSLGVFLAGIAEERLGQRKAYLAEGLSQAQWAAPSPAKAQAGRQADMDAAPSARGPWYNNQPQQTQYDQPTPAPWGAGSWQQWPVYDQPPNQPYSQPFGQSFNQPPDPSQDPSRDPWSRVERHAPYHQPSRPIGPPAPDQQMNPWSQNPSQPAPRPPSQWPPSQPQPQSQPQPPQGPSPWSPWPQDPQPQDGQRPSQSREQWPLDEWDSRPMQ
ncbi:MAG TPA: DUF4383 domain-containing protein [Ktedonobacterales bacterium]|nr:DUF4383 domain-containing protein [Ktedonobacterales bacterium]